MFSSVRGLVTRLYGSVSLELLFMIQDDTSPDSEVGSGGMGMRAAVRHGGPDIDPRCNTACWQGGSVPFKARPSGPTDAAVWAIL